MLWCETAGDERHDVENLAVLVSQLARHGLPACVDVAAVRPGLARNAQFDLAPYLRDGPPEPGDRALLLAAHRLSDRRLAELRRLAAERACDCTAFGSFPSRQAMIGTVAKLSYLFGRDPRLVDLSAQAGRGLGEDAPVFGTPRLREADPRPRLLVVGPPLENAAQAAALVALALHRQFETAVLTDGRTKQAWNAAQGHAIPFYHYGEILPAALAERVDLCVAFVPLQNNYRLQCLIANLAVSGGVLLDGTAGHRLAEINDAFLRAPLDLAGLAAFVSGEILPNLARVAEHVRASGFAARCGEAALDAFLDGPGSRAGDDAVPRKLRPARPIGAARSRIVFMPTNGIGLGHAQRCTLIARELDRDRAEPVFAAFPSCSRLIKSCGFDVAPLVPRSALHAQKHENDLANYLRLRALAEGARTLVFDGGYVFDSVYRTIAEERLCGVWVRRGLWQSSQDNAIALDREKVFTRVIVPEEAFEELNVSYSRGDHLHAVTPVVQRLAPGPEGRGALRARLAERYGRDFEWLVVTQLGAGVAADRGGQVQALCGMLERRTGVLHLVVVWPTAILQPAWFGWSRSRVVKTHHAGVLAASADLCISAAGYNSFHETLYNANPAIFIPQMSAFMDDQRARARAAEERGLAGYVEPHELVKLEREIARHLDDGEAQAVRSRLAALALPEPGNARAAALIEEVTHGDASLDRATLAHRPARRR